MMISIPEKDEFLKRVVRFGRQVSSTGKIVRIVERSVRQYFVAVIDRRQLARIADLDDQMLADVGLTRSDLRAASSIPFWQSPTRFLERRVRPLSSR